MITATPNSDLPSKGNRAEIRGGFWHRGSAGVWGHTFLTSVHQIGVEIVTGIVEAKISGRSLFDGQTNGLGNGAGTVAATV